MRNHEAYIPFPQSSLFLFAIAFIYSRRRMNNEVAYDHTDLCIKG